jgi:hypothetical protein
MTERRNSKMLCGILLGSGGFCIAVADHGGWLSRYLQFPKLLPLDSPHVR